MQKIPITLTLAWLALIATTLPHVTYAERVLCATPMECYEKAMEKLQQALQIVETQRIENEQLKRKVAEMEWKNQRLDEKVAQMEKQIAYNIRVRYFDNGDGTVTDNRTGLIWLKNANCFSEQEWEDAMKSATNLADGQCGLRDGSSRGMWRLPTKEEWEAMIDTKYVDRKKYSQPALSNAAGNGPWTEGDVFSGVQANGYWSSTTYADSASNAWDVYLSHGGSVGISAKASSYYVWPVRGGQ